MNSKLIKVIKVALSFLIILGLFSLSAYYEYDRSVENEKRIVKDHLTVVQTSLDHIIQSRMISASSLVSFISSENQMPKEHFDVFAKEIFDDGSLIRGIFYITDTTITHMYPEDQKNVIGVDLAEIEDQRDLLLFAKEHMVAVLAAPVNLVEGGVGIIVRIPIARDNMYVGQIAIIFDYNQVIKASGIAALSSKYDIELSTMDAISLEERIIWTNRESDALIFKKQALSQDVELYSSNIVIKMYPKSGWNVYSALFFMLIMTGILVSIVMAYFTNYTETSNSKLKLTNKELEVTIKQLISSEKQLTQQYDEILNKESTIQYLAEHDALTGLFNRRKFVENLEMNLQYKQVGTIILLDLDNFKNINDSLGHLYGDKILSEVARRIEHAVSDSSEVFRFGGDEFVILIPNTVDPNAIEPCIEQVANGIKQGIQIDAIKNHISASYGISRYPLDGDTVMDLMSKADIAMYHAKKNGKNQRHYYDAHMSSEFEKRVSIEKKLHDAIENDLFMMVYQPIIEVQTQKVVGFEALIRLKDFSLAPDVFIPVAEETLMILDIGKWVICEVLDQIVRWKNRGLDILPVAVNVSTKQIIDGQVVDFLRECLEARHLEPSVIEIEITESVLLENREESIKVLNQLKSLGVRIALDDFGTGYSSLNYLTFLPVDSIKIDRSLKERFIHHEHSKIIDSLVYIAHSLGFKVVIEGVETVEEYNKLAPKECDFMQGYLFSRPVTADYVDKYLVDTQLNIWNI